ncbi:MAG: hypothetical protein C4294_08560, partial [Nitrospiraceae bacterium]
MAFSSRLGLDERRSDRLGHCADSLHGGRQVEQPATLGIVKRFVHIGSTCKKEIIFRVHRAHGQAYAGEPAALVHQRFKDSDLLPAPAIAEDDLRRGRAQAAAEGEHALRERMSHAVGVGVVRTLAHAVGA